VTSARYTIEPLGRQHRRAAFACGSADLDRYFRHQAGQDQRRRIAAVFVAVDAQTGDEVAGFYTLSATAVRAAELPEDVAARLPRYPLLPAILLGRLARDERWRGQGVGELLLTDALRRSLAISGHLGALFVVVDAKDAAAVVFYERRGFRRFPDQPNRLFIGLGTVAGLGF
jgi:GNAT superfamily N-acetyltransferase